MRTAALIAVLVTCLIGHAPAIGQPPQQPRGHALYQAPRGWRSFSRDDVAFFVPAGLTRTENVVLTVLPDQRVEGNDGGATWFRAVVRQALSGLRVVHTDRIVGTRTASGYDPIMSGAVTEARGGRRLYWFFGGRCHRSRGVAISYSASSPELFRRFRADVSALFNGLTMVVVAPPGGDRESVKDR